LIPLYLYLDLTSRLRVTLSRRAMYHAYGRR